MVKKPTTFIFTKDIEAEYFSGDIISGVYPAQLCNQK